MSPRASNDVRVLRNRILAELAEAQAFLISNVDQPLDMNAKDRLRSMHSRQRLERSKKLLDLVETHGPSLLQHFAIGSEINPGRFEPILIPVDSGTEQSLLFRFATLLWSIPVSEGYGRRMRFLILDAWNEKLVGLFALGDAVFNLRARDEDIGWSSEDRRSRLFNVLDAYVLGAVPPYNALICGKLVALAALSDEVRRAFAHKYRGRRTIIEYRKKRASLVLVTTTSALGRSSIYNRLKLASEAEPAYRSVGFSEGWGHFHISDASFNQLRDLLRASGDTYADGHGFGQGPNWRMRTLRRGLGHLGLDENLLRHGIRREVFIAPTATNYREFLRGEQSRPHYYHRPLEALADEFRTRWMIPRSARVSEWKAWRREDTWDLISSNSGLPLSRPVF